MQEEAREAKQAASQAQQQAQDELQRWRAEAERSAKEVGEVRERARGLLEEKDAQLQAARVS